MDGREIGSRRASEREGTGLSTHSSTQYTAVHRTQHTASDKPPQRTNNRASFVGDAEKPPSQSLPNNHNAPNPGRHTAQHACEINKYPTHGTRIAQQHTYQLGGFAWRDGERYVVFLWWGGLFFSLLRSKTVLKVARHRKDRNLLPAGCVLASGSCFFLRAR